MKRYHAIDKIRGLLIVYMGIGHAVAFSTGGFSTELWFRDSSAYVDTATFLVRMVTQNAPIFFFILMGLSMTLLRASRLKRGWSETQVTSYFMRRALLLIFWQFTVINLGWRVGEGGIVWNDITLASFFDLRPVSRYFGVLFALGSSMALISLLLRVNAKTLGGLACIILISPMVYLAPLDYPQITAQLPSWIGPLAIPGKWPGLFVLYSVFPWVGLSMIGVLLGRLLLADPVQFEKLLLWGGLLALATFISATGIKWVMMEPTRAIDLFHMTRYPPEPLMIIYAIGVNFLIFWIFTKIDLGPLDSMLITFGRSALFFYVIHLFVFAALAMLVAHKGSLETALAHAVLGLTLLLPICWIYLQRVKPVFQNHYSTLF